MRLFAADLEFRLGWNWTSFRLPGWWSMLSCRSLLHLAENTRPQFRNAFFAPIAVIRGRARRLLASRKLSRDARQINSSLGSTSDLWPGSTISSMRERWKPTLNQILDFYSDNADLDHRHLVAVQIRIPCRVGSNGQAWAGYAGAEQIGNQRSPQFAANVTRKRSDQRARGPPAPSSGGPNLSPSGRVGLT